MFSRLREEIQGIMARDPAARSTLEVVLNYPSFHAMLFYRVASWLWRHRLRILGRWVSQWGRFWTGIEIHPGAKIGRRVFIDHGMGVVVGETAEIGDDVTLYHGVTLGGTAPAIDSDKQRNVKRHPTLEDGVIVGAGAQVLGPITVGRNARVGANAVVVREVSPGMTVTGIPARAVMPKDKSRADAFVAYGTPGDIPDPLVPALETMRSQIATMAERIDELEGRLAERDEAEAPRRAGRKNCA
ncbi:MAG: serine O-acetyltransferase EpsC [Bauldia litoralis]